jgi:LPS export ABC transporter protein LptC
MKNIPIFAYCSSMRRIFQMLVLVFSLWGCTRSDKENEHLKHLEEGAPIKEAFQVKFLFSEDAILQAKLEAPHAIEAQEDGQDIRIFDRGMHLTFYNAEGKPKSDLTSDNGKFRNQFNDAEVWGNVVMVNEKGDLLETEHLFWNKTINRIHTKDFVKIKTESEIIYGDSMDANTDFTEYRIYNIVGSVSIKNGGL